MSRPTGGGETSEKVLSYSVSRYIQKYLQNDLEDLKDFMRQVGGSLKVDEINSSFHFNFPQKCQRYVEERLSKIECNLKTKTFTIPTLGSYHVLKSIEGQSEVDAIEQKYHCVIDLIDEHSTYRDDSSAKNREDHERWTSVFNKISSKAHLVYTTIAKKKDMKINKRKGNEGISGEQTYDLDEVQLVLTHAEITDTNAQILVSTVDSEQKLSGKLVRMLLSKAQPGLKKAIQRNQKYEVGKLFVTEGYGIPYCRCICHVIIPGQLGSEPHEIVSTLVRRTLSQANISYECESIAFSALSFETLGLQPEDIGLAFCRAILDYTMENNTRLKVIKLSLPTRRAVQNVCECIDTKILRRTMQNMTTELTELSVSGDECGSSVDSTCDQGMAESFVEGDTYMMPRSPPCQVTGEATMDFSSVEGTLEDVVKRLKYDVVCDLPEPPRKLDGDDDDEDSFYRRLIKELFIICSQQKVVQVPDTANRKVRLMGSKGAVGRAISALHEIDAHLKE